MPDQTLPTLIRISRTKPVTRWLCCPVCSSDITLADGVLGCERGHSFLELKELAIKGATV